MVKNLASLGKTVLLTTHYMDEAQYLADRVAVIAAGRIVAEGHAGHARRPEPRPGAHQVPAARRRRAARIELGGAQDAAGFTVITSADPVRDLHRLTGWALDNGSPWTGSRSPGRRSRTSTCR